MSKEEWEEALSALIEELEKYKMHLDQLVDRPRASTQQFSQTQGNGST
ncbi:hypothetical protein [Chlamydia abortus]|nr:hypothetical protein [Chlamydia abortus]